MRSFIQPRLIILLVMAMSLLSVPVYFQAHASTSYVSSQSQSTSDPGSEFPFIENVGQFPDAVRFKAGNLWLTEDGLWLTTQEPQAAPKTDALREQVATSATTPVVTGQRGVNLRLSFIGANPQTHLEPFGRQKTHIYYFQGNDPAHWHRNVPVWMGVRYINLYPGFDLVISSLNGEWVWKFVPNDETKTSSDLLASVQLHIEGGDNLTLTDAKLQVDTTLGKIPLPLITLDPNAATVQSLQMTPVITSDKVSHPFTTISPSITKVKTLTAASFQWATYLGGSGSDVASAVALSDDGDVVVAGETSSSDFPVTAGAFDTAYNKYTDGFVARLSADGSSLQWATYLGGSSNDVASAVALTGEGDVVVVGRTAVSKEQQEEFTPLRYITLWRVDALTITHPISGTISTVNNTISQPDLPGVIVHELEGRSYLVIVPPTQSFELSFTSTTSHLVEITEGDGNEKITAVTRYRDLPALQGQEILIIDPIQFAKLGRDENNDGLVDINIEPSGSAAGAAAKDTIPPIVTISATNQKRNEALVTISAVDSESDLQSVLYSTDSQHYMPYTSPFFATTGTTIYAFADDAVGNRSQETVYKVPLQEDSYYLFLPTMRR